MNRQPTVCPEEAGVSNQAIYPLTFIPQLRDYIWGGRNLETLYGRTLPPGVTAESWEISGHPSAPAMVENGPLAGQSLPRVLRRYGQALVGSNAQWALARNRFPLLVKLLDANQNLSVQVHPDDAYALAHEKGELGKTEMWYVLHARPGAQIIFGLKAGVTPEAFRQAIGDGSLETWLHYLPIRAGDAIFVAAGSIHALLAGAVVVEIQQNSDTTYRVYDWGRVGADGRPRQLHVQKALEVINFEQIEPGPYPPGVVFDRNGITRAEISRCDYFVVERVSFEAGCSYQGHTNGHSLEIWGAVEGSGILLWQGEQLELPAIRFVLVPATQGDFRITAPEACVMLRAYLP